MRHRNTTKTLGRKKASREAMLRNLATSIVLHETVRTTSAKASVVRPIVEKAVTRGKESTLHARRELMKLFMTEGAVNKVLEIIGPRYATRPGGYTRITKIGSRLGDGAEMVEISFV
ncbi:50S ribosomal protein L17 [Candidatus Uhrbacteria bacterium CG10_big_fil_rev_8_21_14_0_10_50_16]|uniref:Large ribosomal subunit protein bL17 n=1 Tax=Candidatus Uhrbacteria bacterium CG10_big_fil_rev_8_21_14_0_10_50_16 TaxID=1975039 RepID=A0A2H0RN75_9BACT|nr:MAG: 50S ribosomal protein L17 [Candidatus Uhrbacteria bacterium CG10_big_fil_rev_8_21_14_0_10_50_16]